MKCKNLIAVIFALVTFLVGASFLVAAEKVPDSINVLIKKLDNPGDEEKLSALHSLTTYYRDRSAHISMIYGKRYLKLALSTNSYHHQGDAYRHLAKSYKDQMEYEQYLHHHLKSLEAFEKTGNKTEQALQWLNVSDGYIHLRKYDSALYFYELAHQFAVENNQTMKIIRSNIQIGKVLTFQDKNAEALEKYQMALDMANKTGDGRYIGWAAYWMGFTYMKLGHFSEAEHYYKISDSAYIRINDGYGRIGALQELGSLYLKTGKNAEAYRWFLKGVQNMDEIPGSTSAKYYQSTSFINMGKVFFSINDYHNALACYDTAMMVAEENDFRAQIAIANASKGDVFYNQADYENALNYYQQALQYYLERESKFAVSDLKNKIGRAYHSYGDYDRALQYFAEALALNQVTGNQYGTALNHVNMAETYYAMANYKKMGTHLDQGMPYAIATKVDDLVLRYYFNYIRHCEHTENHAKTHTFFNKYLTLSQKVSQNNISNLTALLIDLHKNELENNKAFYTQEMNLRKLERERDTLRINQMILLVIVIALIAVVLAGLYFYKTRTARKLSRLVEERTDELKKNEQKLIEVNATREKFYSIIAHDLKSPFNSLIGFSNLLMDDYHNFSDEERMQFIKIINDSSENIFNLLENLLDWTHRSSGRLQLKPVKTDLNQSVKKAIQLQEKNAIAKHISILNQIPKNTFVFADENAIYTILRNLLSNAIKFTPENGSITFNAQKQDGHIHCTVSDTGTGLSEAEIDKILDISKTLSKKGTSKEKGTGLGLSLIKDFVEQSGGKLTIKSQKKQGSHFTFSLPAK